MTIRRLLFIWMFLLTWTAACGASSELIRVDDYDSVEEVEEDWTPPPLVRPTFSAADNGVMLSVIDVGQGDGLILSAQGKTMVIDAGTGRGGKAIDRQLEVFGVRRINTLVLTHPHADHIGGAPFLIKKWPIDEVWHSGEEAKSKIHQKTMDLLREKNIPTLTPKRGHKIQFSKDVSVTVLYPEIPRISGSRSDANSNSVVLWVNHGEVDFLLTGDAEEPTEHRLVEIIKDTPMGDLEVLKVAHHGSSHSSTEAFLKHFPSDIAVISCGRRNRYKHPKPEALQRIEAMGAKIHRTDHEGTIHIRSDGKTFKVNTEGVPFSFILRRPTMSLSHQAA